MNVVRIVLNGVGKLGRAIISASKDSTQAKSRAKVVAGVDEHLVPSADVGHVSVEGVPVYGSLEDVSRKFHVLMDCSRAEGLETVVDFALSRGKPLVVAATGHSEAQLALLAEAAAQIPILRSTNLSVGVNVTRRLVEEASKMLGDVDVEVVEAHHRMKVDAPSGTALTLAEAARDVTGTNRPFVFGRGPDTPGKRGQEIGIHAVRGGTVVGEHTVTFLLEDEMVQIRHVAQSRQVFGYGALKAASFIKGQPPGLYDMGDLLD